MSHGQKLFYRVKGLVKRDTHVQYESSTYHFWFESYDQGKKNRKQVKFQGQGQKLLYHLKDLVTRNTHACNVKAKSRKYRGMLRLHNPEK